MAGSMAVRPSPVLCVICWLFACDFISVWQVCASNQLPSAHYTDSQDGQEIVPLNYDDMFAYGCLHEIPIPRFVPEDMFTLEQEKEVLIELYKRTGGSQWKNNSGWRKPASNTSHCTWYGVTCHNATGHVISLFLMDNHLSGALPPSLWKLRNLQGLCIGSNPELGGELCDFLSPNMTNLLRLDVAYNKHSGEIPGDILVKMESLVKIQLCGQMGGKLRGKIPEDIGNLKELQVLSLGENVLEGSIPKSISKLRKLWFLDLETTQGLTEGLENLYNVSSIRFMHLSLSGLGGSLPDKFGSFFPAMQECLLTGNRFTGPIPSSIGEMRNLVHLNLAHNKFFGLIPKGLGTAPLLQIMDLTDNDLTAFEDGFKINSPLEVLLLAENQQLNMKLDDLFDAFEANSTQSLRILNITKCGFYGKISIKLWQFKGLISVRFSTNKLNGTLPIPSDNALFLLHLDFSYNDLHGKIPQQFSKLLALQYLDISGNPRMSGVTSQSSRSLPNFIKADFSTLTHKKSSDKFQCPNARLLLTKGIVILDPEYYNYKFCLCDTGFYGSDGVCLKCMEGGTCKEAWLPHQEMFINPGYWPSPHADNVTHLVRCSDKMGPGYKGVCTPHDGGRGCDCRIEWVLSRLDGNLTEQVTVCSNSCICKNGSTDRFCSKCLYGYYREGNFCYRCSDTSFSFVVTTLVLFSFLCVVLLLFKLKRAWKIGLLPAQILLLALLASLKIIPLWLFEINTIVLLFGVVTGQGKTARGLAKISVFYTQTLGSLISTTGDIWPPQVTVIQRYISNVFNLHLSGLGCALPDLFTPVGKLAFVLLIPVACLCGTVLFYGVACIFLQYCQCCANDENRKRKLRNACRQVVITSLNLTYFPIVKDSFAVLAPCQEDGPFSFMPVAPWLPCDGHTYTVLTILGSLSMIYVLGVPFLLFLPLLTRVASKRDDLDEDERQKMDSWLGSIYLPYKKDFRSYFEVLFLLRRMLIAIFLSFIPRTYTSQTITVCTVLLAAMSFQLFFRPFESSLRRVSLENTVETIVLVVLHFSFMNIRYVSLEASPETPLVWLLIAMNGAVILVLVVSVLIVFIDSYTAGAAGNSAETGVVVGDGQQGEGPTGGVAEGGGGASADEASERSPLLPGSATNTAYNTVSRP